MSIKKSKEQFIKELKELYEDKFIYDKTHYKSSHDFVTLTCPFHGDFERRAYSLLQRNATCPLCSKTSKWTNKKFDLEIKKIHQCSIERVGEYKNSHTNINMKCNVCSLQWSSRPYNLIHNRSGCPKCSIKRNGDNIKEQWKDPEYKYKVIEGMKKSYTTDKRKIATKKIREFWKNNPEKWENMIKHMKETHRTDEYRKKMSNIKQQSILNGEFTPGGYKNHKKGYYKNFHFMSSYEKNFLMFIDNNYNLSDLEWQTERIPYTVDGKNYVYIIDAKLENKLIEIKANGLLCESFYKSKSAKLEYKKLQAKLEAAFNYAASNSLNFEIWTEKTHPFLLG